MVSVTMGEYHLRVSLGESNGRKNSSINSSKWDILMVEYMVRSHLGKMGAAVAFCESGG